MDADEIVQNVLKQKHTLNFGSGTNPTNKKHSSQLWNWRDSKSNYAEFVMQKSLKTSFYWLKGQISTLEVTWLDSSYGTECAEESLT